VSDATASLAAYVAALEPALAAALPAAADCHPRLRAAMAHGLLGGGKRLRAQLLAGAMQLGRYDAASALAGGCALEMLHAYSLIHDDLPAMDDDDLRRGRPTCHRVYGEAMAILAGDALQAEAFTQLLTAVRAAALPRDSALAALADFAAAAGAQQLVGGQAGDLEPPASLPALAQVHWIHTRKTAALIRCSLLLGGRLGGLPATTLALLAEAGLELGLAFQAVDDLLDEEASAAELGKTPGKDRAQGKLTLTAVQGAAATRQECEDRLARALTLLPAGESAAPLRALARRLVERRS
jgi:geranylgeranyl pyrophosphate synthase